MEHAEYLAIKDRAWELFSKIPGVHAVGIGKKIVGGRRTSERAIMVFVVRKKERAQLAPADLIPATIEAVATDVVEMPEPRFLAGETIEPEVGPDPTGPGIQVRLRTTLQEPIPFGHEVVLVVIVTTTATAASTVYVATGTTGDDRSLIAIAALLVQFSNPQGFKASHLPGIPVIIIEAQTGHSVEVDCYGITYDNSSYIHQVGRALRGGIALGGSGISGTLGVLATMAPTSKEPNGTVVAITNHHCVSTTSRAPTKLEAVSTDAKEILIRGPEVVPDARVVVKFVNAGRVESVALYLTRPDDSLDDVARGVAEAINGAPLGGITASAVGNLVAVTNADGPGRGMTSEAWGTVIARPNVHLRGVVTTVPTLLPFTHVVSFHGEKSAEPYGVYLNVTPGGGTTPSFSVFLDPSGLETSQIATQLEESITKLPIEVRGVVGAKAAGPALSLSRAQSVECAIQVTEVGQPTSNFTWPCSDFIGKVIDARGDVDAAVIQLDAGMSYSPVIEGIGPVNGEFPESLLEPGLAVQKRGCTSGVTTGEVFALDVTGAVGKESGFGRFYKHVMIVQSTTTGPLIGTPRPFILSGDSGSALVTHGTPAKVVGLLFGGTELQGFATPIGRVVDAFRALKLSFDLAPGQDATVIRSVPQKAVLKRTRLEEAAPTSVAGSRRPGGMGGRSSLAARLSHAHDEVARTSAGRACADAVQRHFREAQTLVNTNRRVGTVWRRYGGPELMNALLEIACGGDRRLPADIRGKPLADCLLHIQRVFSRYATPALSKDLARYIPQIASWSGMSYAELLASFQPAETP